MGETGSREHQGKKKRRMGLLRTVLFVVFLGVFLVSAGMLIHNYLEGKKVQDDFSSLLVSGTHDLAALHEKNSDIVAWIKIDGTNIDYPVMQTKDEPEYYLRRNFNKEHSIAGTPFMDGESDIDLPTLNWIVYGHNMKNGTMFHDLLEYEDETFYQEHKTFTFDTINEDGTYEVVAAFYTQIYTSDYEGFKYYKYTGTTSQSALKEFLSGALGLALYDTGVAVEEGEQVLTLSTCAYQVEDGRFVVVAKKVQ